LWYARISATDLRDQSAVGLLKGADAILGLCAGGAVRALIAKPDRSMRLRQSRSHGDKESVEVAARLTTPAIDPIIAARGPKGPWDQLAAFRRLL